MKIKKGLSLSVVFALVLLLILWQLSRTPGKYYSYTEACYADIASTITISGKISSDREVEIMPRISAYVSDIPVKCGDIVKKGQCLAILEAIPDIFALEEANAAVELERIALKQAETDFERASNLYAGQNISTKEYEQALNALSIAEEKLAFALNRRSIVVGGSSERSPEYDESVVHSPVDGVISAIYVNQGETVSRIGKPICTVADNGPLVFKGYVDETDVVYIGKGMELTLVLGAVPDIVIPAEIVSVSSFGRSEGGFTQFEIKASLTSVPDGIELRSGFSANARIVTRKADHVLSVPEECIRFDKNHMPYVLRLTSSPRNRRHQRWEQVPVTLGISDGKTIQVISGLEEHNLVRSISKNAI